MSKRLTRKQIKEDIRHDELQTAVTSTVDSITSHRNLVIWAVVAVVAVAAAVSIALYWKEKSDKGASLELAKAIEIYEAPILETGAKPDDPDHPSFSSEQERRAKAREAFEAVSGGTAADVASLFLAEMSLAEGDKETARATWEAFLKDHKTHVLALAVRRDLIRLDREEGKGDEVVQELQAELSSEEKNLPEDLLLFELAETLDSLDRGEEAETYYKRILDDYPSSSFASQARQKTSS